MKSKKLRACSLIKIGVRSRGIYDRIRKIIEDARGNIARVINTEMVVAYWQIGREIVEEKQRGKSRAGYGEAILVKDLMIVIYGICVNSIRHIQFSTQCVEN